MFNEKEYMQIYRKKYKNHIKKLKQKWCKLHKKHKQNKARLWYLKNKIRILNKLKKYRQEHKEEKRYIDKIYYLNHKKYLLKKHKQYICNRLKTDINFKIRHNLKHRIYLVLKGINKSVSTMRLVGCSIKHLKQHLQKQFKKGMTWKNYGKWHIDHIRPCASFDLTKAEEQHKCFHYTNLQPLWAEENLRKSDKYDNKKY